MQETKSHQEARLHLATRQQMQERESAAIKQQFSALEAELEEFRTEL